MRHTAKSFTAFFRICLLITGLALGYPAAHAATAAIGTAPGQFSVNPTTGAGSYQIPIEVVPGVNGLKPSLALVYNSQSGNGLMGQGWSLSGDSVISRCPQTIDQDQAEHEPDLSTADRFCLDGQRLIVTSGSYGYGGSVYHTEIESFQQVTANGSSSAAPTSFTITDRTGMTSQYSTIVKGGDGVTPLEWLITSTKDRYGNYINFQYSITAASPPYKGAWDVVSQIDYGSASGTAVGHVIFTYNNGNPGQLRSDTYTQYFARTLIEVNPVPLTSITVEDGSGNVIRTYTLGYQYSNPIPITLLTSVTECGSDGSCYPATQLSYSGAAPAFNAGGDYFGNRTGMNTYQVADFDGDGLPDYVFAKDNTVYVVFGNNYVSRVTVPVQLANSGQAGIGIAGSVVIDLNGDGHQELLVPYYPNPGPSNDEPYWMMLSWNGQTGANANLTFTQVPTPNNIFGQPTYLEGCDPSTPSCSVDAIAVDVGRKGQAGMLFASGGKLYYYPNVGTPPTIGITPWVGGGELSPTPIATGISYNNVAGGPPTMTVVNYSGEGQAEVYVAGTGVIKWNPTLNGGQGNFQLYGPGNFGEPPNSNQFGFYALFVNGDGSGLTSAVMVNTAAGALTYYTNTGYGFYFYSNDPTNNNVTYTPTGADLTQLQPVDWFGDGRQELIVPVTGGDWWLFETGVAGGIFVDTGVKAMNSPTQFVDVNGDNEPEMIFPSDDGAGSYQFLLNTGRPYLLNQITNGLGHNTDVGYMPMDQEIRGAYVSQPNLAITSAPQIHPYMGPMYVVNDFAVDTGLVNSSGLEQLYTYYLYGGAEIDQWGRGFLGFSEVESINYNTGIYTNDTYRQDFPFTGLIATSTKSWNPGITTPQTASVGGTGAIVSCVTLHPNQEDCEAAARLALPATTFVTGGDLISSTSNSYLDDVSTYSGVYFPFQSTTTTQSYELGASSPYESSTTTTNYQNEGTNSFFGEDVMPYDVKVTTQDNAPNNGTDVGTVDTQSSYGYETTCPGHTSSVTVTHTFQGTSYPYQTETFGYDGNCFLTSDQKTIVGPPGSSLSMILSKTYTPDGYGNPLTTTVSGASVAARTTNMTYDATERFPATIQHVVVNNNATTYQTENLTYDSVGDKLTDTDANGDTLTYLYDGFQRKVKQIGPQPAVTAKWFYEPCTSGCAFQVAENTSLHSGAIINSGTPSGKAFTVTEYDDLARPIETQTTGFNGAVVFQDTQYDLLGRVAQTSLPYIPANSQIECWDIKTYDVLNRVTVETQPYGATTSSCGSTRTIDYGYAGLQATKTINATGSVPSETTTTNLNVLGKPSSVVDEGGSGNSNVTTSYTYDPWGNLASSTPPGGAAVSMTYDSAGDKLSMQDPDMGSWSYTYDELGELLTQTDAKGQQVTNVYDSLGRLKRRTEPEGITKWFYDIAYGAGIGKLAYTSGPNGVWEGYAYDAYGETTDKITIVNNQEYWVTTTYTDLGQVNQVVYPDLTAINVSGTPATPTGLTVAPDSTGMVFDLNWTLAQTGQFYYLFRTPASANAPGAGNVIYSGPQPDFPDNGITTDGSYKWWLEACYNNNCSGYTTVTMTVTLPPTVPGAPQGLTDSHQRNVTLTWAGSKSQGGTTGALTYNVYAAFTLYGSTQQGAATLLTPSGVADSGGSTTSTTVTLSQDGTYAFTVAACQGGVCSAPSGARSYTTVLTPATPGSLTAPASVAPTSSPASIALSWTASGFTGGPITYEVQVENTLASGTTFVDTAQEPGSSTSATDSETLDGKYLYRVRACDSNEAGICSGYTQAGSATVVTLPPGLPGAPVPPNADLHSTAWQVTWNAASMGNNGSTGTISYQLQQSLNGSSYAALSNPVTVSGGTANEYAAAVFSGNYYQNGTYTYEVSACNNDTATGVACTGYVTGSAGYTTVIPPVTPSSITVASVSNGDGTIPVSFGASTGGGTVTTYKVHLGLKDGETGNMDWTYGGCSASAPNLSCTIGYIAAQVNETFQVEVVACDSSQCSSGEQASNPVTITLAPPSTPKLSHTPLLVNVGSSVTFTMTSNGGIETYFVLQKEMGGGDSFNTVYSDVGPTYTTPNFTTSGDYYYQLAACNPSACSAFTSPPVDVVVNNPHGGPGNLVMPNGRPSEESFDGYIAPQVPLAYAAPDSLTPMRDVGFAPLQHLPMPVAPGSGSGGVAAGTYSVPQVPQPIYAALAPLSVTEDVGPLPMLSQLMPGITLATSAVLDSTQLGESAQFAFAEPVQSEQVATLDPRQAYFRAHAGRTTQPRTQALGSVVATVHFAQPIDPKLSKYPPLRRDARVQSHYESIGGALPAEVKDVDCGEDSTDCSEPSESTALMVGYQYTGYGYLAQVNKLDSNGNPLQVLWMAEQENAQGEVLEECFDAPYISGASQCSGQSLDVSSNYDSATGLLDGTTATAYDTTGGNTALNASYSWDGYNNLQSRSVRETLAGVSVVSPLSETFTYDAVNRVTDNGTMTYNSEGGFLTNGVYTGYQYAGNGATGCAANYAQPHAVSSVNANGTTRTFCYDQNGNLISETGDVNRSITWTSYNKPSQITSNGVTESFTYGPSRERLMTAVSGSPNDPAGDTVTTTYIDGLFEAVSDSSTGSTTYRHYILVGSERVGQETIQANSSGQVTADVLRFFIHDEVGSAIAAATENLGGTNQKFGAYSFDLWGKARATSGSSAYTDPAAGTFLTGTLPGQEEGFGGHEELEDIGIVDMEGRVYDPELGRFLSADPNVQYPDSSQGYNRYTYVNDNPLSLNDPSGYFAGSPVLGIAAAIVVTWACDGTCGGEVGSAFLAGAAQGYVSSGGNIRQGVLTGVEAMAFAYAGMGTDNQPMSEADLAGRSVMEGIIAGDFSVIEGGRFADGFEGAFAGGMASPLVSDIGGSPATNADYYDPAYESARVAVSAVVGGTISKLTGGDFAEGAISAAMQRLYNDDHNDERLKQVQKEVAARAAVAIAMLKAEYGETYIVEQDTYRSWEEEDYLHSIGRSQVLGGWSWHNYGLAVDVVEIINGKADWHYTHVSALRTAFGSEGFSYYSSGYDPGHFYMPMGQTLQQLYFRATELRIPQGVPYWP